MAFTAEQAGVVAQVFDFSADDPKWLTAVPYEGSLPTSVPTDPLIVEEDNVLIHPTHADALHIVAVKVRRFVYDHRV